MKWPRLKRNMKKKGIMNSLDLQRLRRLFLSHPIFLSTLQTNLTDAKINQQTSSASRFVSSRKGTSPRADNDVSKFCRDWEKKVGKEILRKKYQERNMEKEMLRKEDWEGRIETERVRRLRENDWGKKFEKERLWNKD